MTKSQCVSVTDLRTQTKKCLQGLADEPKFIFINNKPIAVIIDIDAYENLCNPSELTELPKSEVTKAMKSNAQKIKSLEKSELINI